MVVAPSISETPLADKAEASHAPVATQDGFNDDEPPPDYDDVYFNEVNQVDEVAPRVDLPRVPSKFAPPPRMSVVKAVAAVKPSAPMVELNIVKSENLPDWAQLIEQLHLRGLVKQLAQQSELLVFDEQRIEIRCENRVLAVSSAAVSGMEKALNAYFKNAPKTLKVHVGAVVAATPAKVQATVKAAELQGAQAIVAQNATVQSLVQEFDGMVLPNSIRAT